MKVSFLEAYEIGLAKVDYWKRHLVDFPHTTRAGEWLVHKNGHWTGGFWTGLLWLRALQSLDPNDFRTAQDWALRFEGRTSDNKTHDQGFIYGPSCVLGYGLIKEEAFIPLVHAGAKNLTDLYNEKAGLILAWDEPGYEGIAIVDTVMNLPLLWISDSWKGETTKKEIMKTVADNILRHHVRSDFSTFHSVKWDEDYQIAPGTHQGASTSSCWSRGQAWALYGFANLYRYSGEERYLDAALQLAEFFYKNLNENLLPSWDFIHRDDRNHPIDAAAASIAAAGMLLISYVLRAGADSAAARLWEERAQNILRAEIEGCLSKRPELYGIIEKVTIDYPRQSGLGESSTYGDYYFMEALYRLQNMGNLPATLLLY